MLQSAISPWRISLVALALVLLALISRKFRFSVIITALLLGSTVMSLREASLQSSQLAAMDGQSAELIAQVVTDPNQTTTGNYSFIARAIYVHTGQLSYGMRIPIRVITPRATVLKLLPGQSFSATSRIIKSKEGRVAALILIDGDVKILTEASRWAKSLAAIRYGLRNLSGDGDAGALIPGMVLGDTAKQSAEFKTAMKRSGLMHLVAVSGANFAIVSSFVLWCMQFIFRRMKLRLSATAIALLCFIALVRPSPSVLRAAAMAAVLLIAQGTNRGRDSLPALGFAMGAVVVGDPWQARDAGFALSVMATAGLLLFSPVIVEKLSRFMPEKLAQALAPPTAAIVFCSPVLVSLSGYLSPISIIANLLAAPAVGPITILGFIAALLSPIAPALSSIIIWCIRFPAGFIAAVARGSAQFPVLTLRTGSIGFLIVALFTLTLWLFKKYMKAISICTLVLIVALTWMQRWPAGDWQVANCDIGQGDSMVLNLGNHRAILIDTGPDPVLEDRCLKALGIDEISLLILSHFHADHVGGISGALKNRTVSTVWISSNAEPILESAHVFSLLKSAHIFLPQRGFVAQVGQYTMRVLWPASGTHTFASMPGEGSAINNSSIAVLIASSELTLFAAGDLEPPAQHELIGDIIPVDIYKVCHHGSRYQDSELMRALHPQIAVISVGAKNMYGHPATQTIDALARLGARIVRTDISGSISIIAKEHRLKIRTSKSRFNLFRLG
ncbi:MAG: ComEC/Rec2 family competence protein [Streptomycetaceae bacterium]|nr:MAG: ComEC/Rec2 family competence protein [Streptomycetaceae bacterium]